MKFKSNDILVRSRNGGSVVTVPSKYSYLGDIISELPENSIIRKGACGCGGTTVAIRNEKNTVIAVPFKSIIDSKISGEGDNIIGVYGGLNSNENELAEIIRNKKGAVKIMVTFDSLPKVIYAIHLAEQDLKDYFVLIDEYHILLTNYGHRYKAINRILDIIPKIPRVSLMSATPILNNFLPSALRNIRNVDYVWKSHSLPCVNLIKTTDISYSIEKTCEYHITHTHKKSHFFVNSVSMFIELAKNEVISPENARIICSEGDVSDATKDNVAKLAELGFTISSTDEDAKQINWYTSTVWEGADLHDETAEIYVAASPSNEALTMDIRTSLVQIAGRIRDINKSRNLNFIVNIPKSDLKKYSQCKKEIDREVRLLKNSILKYNKRRLTEIVEPFKYKGGIEFFRQEESCGEVFYDDMLKISYLFRTRLRTDVYSTYDSVVYELEHSGFKIKGMEFNLAPKKEQTTDRVKFEDVVLSYYEKSKQLGVLYSEKEKCYKDWNRSEKLEHSAKIKFISDEMVVLENKRPILPALYKYVDLMEIARLKYNAKSCESALVKAKAIAFSKEQDMEISMKLSESISLDKPYKTKDLESKLSGVFRSIGLNKDVSWKDLNKWMDVSGVIVKNKDTGKRERLKVVTAIKDRQAVFDFAKDTAKEFGLKTMSLKDKNGAESLKFIFDAHRYLTQVEIKDTNGSVNVAMDLIEQKKANQMSEILKGDIFYSELYSKTRTNSSKTIDQILNSIKCVYEGFGYDSSKLDSSIVYEYYNLDERPEEYTPKGNLKKTKYFITRKIKEDELREEAR